MAGARMGRAKARINIHRDRSRYEGQWRNDRRSGYGAEVLAPGGSLVAS
jgi:hypothetical protein